MDAPTKIWPVRLKIRDTGLHDDLGGSGQHIYTTAGQGYERQEYILATEHARIVAERDARIAELKDRLRWAHDTLYEINPSNYDHDEVMRLNDASVEVILGIAPLIGERHGRSDDWWSSRAALKGDDNG